MCTSWTVGTATATAASRVATKIVSFIAALIMTAQKYLRLTRGVDVQGKKGVVEDKERT